MQRLTSRIPRHTLVAALLFLVALLLFVVSLLSSAAADFINFRLGGALRAVPTALTAIFPFSVIEIVLILALPAAIFLLVYLIRRAGSREQFYRSLAGCLTAILLFAAFYLVTVAPGYRTSRLSDRLGLAEQEIDEEILRDTALYLLREARSLEGELARGENGATVLSLDFSDLTKEILRGYEAIDPSGKLSSPSAARLKPVMLSSLMSSAHFLGIWSYVTGETNINTQFPDYTIPYTAAHEMAHQRGIAREDEANFMAFLALSACDDPYLRYSGYLGLYEYVSYALYEHYPDTYFSVVLPELGDGVRDEMIAYEEFFEPHEGSTLSEITGAVNDAYLKANGTSGEASYGEVVRLAVAYYADLKK